MTYPLTVFVEPYSTTNNAEKLSSTPFSVERDCLTMVCMKSHIRERIKSARLHSGYTQEKLGELIGISKSAVSMWETTNPDKWTRPTLDNLKALSRITGAPLDWLLDDDAEISAEWKRPAEVVQFPKAGVINELANEAAGLICKLSQDEQLEVLHYLRVRTQTKAPQI